jgi:hypothetical protein
MKVFLKSKAGFSRWLSMSLNRRRHFFYEKESTGFRIPAKIDWSTASVVALAFPAFDNSHAPSLMVALFSMSIFIRLSKVGSSGASSFSSIEISILITSSYIDDDRLGQFEVLSKND